MAVEQKLYTVDDLWKLSSATDKRYELVRGVLIEMSPTGGIHGEIAIWLGSLLITFVRANKLGRVFGAETGFALPEAPDTVRAPDIAFVSKEKLTSSTEKYPPVAPDLAVEIVSPSNTQSEMHEKVVDYFASGTRLVWILYPKSRAIYVYKSPTEVSILGVNDTLDGSDVLSGFKVTVKEIFDVLDTEN